MEKSRIRKRSDASDTIKKVCEKYGARYENSQPISEILTSTLKWITIGDSLSVIPGSIQQLEEMLDKTEAQKNVKKVYKPMTGRALGKLVEEIFSNSLEITPSKVEA